LEKMLDEDEFFSDHGIRSSVSFFISSIPWLWFLRIGCQRSTRMNHGGWMLMDRGMRWIIGLVIPGLRCLVAIRTGEGQFVRRISPLCTYHGVDLWFIGLAVNMLLIESLQRFYQYYGDDVRVRSSCAFSSWPLTFYCRWSVLRAVGIIWTSSKLLMKFSTG
jgi:hypothetical protein